MIGYLAVFAVVFVSCAAQRSPYAGRNPIGYPALTPTTTTPAPLANRFGDEVSTTTVRLPIEALGDVELYNRLSKLPIDQQPFWLINWKALEDNRQQSQTYNQKVNSFLDNDFNVKG